MSADALGAAVATTDRHVRVLLIEDEARVAAFLRRGLAAEGWLMTHAADGDTGFAYAHDTTFDVIVLDLMIPGLHGLEICRKLRAEGVSTPVLMLTALDDLDHRLEGFAAGADDYLVKPFALAELVARIQALLRRSAGGDRSTLSLGSVVLDLNDKTARRGGRPISLTGTEFKLLRCLMSRAGRAVSRPDILKDVWGYDFDPGTNVVEVYVAYLRRKLDKPPHKPCIGTVRGVGYRFVADD